MSKLKLGDLVYHKSNPDIITVVIEINEKGITCRRIDDKGVTRSELFQEFELDKEEPIDIPNPFV